MSKTYAVREVFYTVQGEGFHAGTPAVFIRFAGCNMWSGRDEHRQRDAKRNAAECPRWCDTDFAEGEELTASRITAEAMHAAFKAGVPEASDVPLIVLTGGEPLLQVDDELLRALRVGLPSALIAVETNGTVEPRAAVDWITVSPKQAPSRLKLLEGDELKVVFPAYDPLAYSKYSEGFEFLYVSAEAATSSVGQSVIVQDNLKRAAEFVMANPAWSLTLQAHKIVGVR